MTHTFYCIDAHTCGNPVRLVRQGGPQLEGATMSEKRQHFLREFDWIRTGLMFEPRGHDMMSGSILYPPHDPQNDPGWNELGCNDVGRIGRQCWQRGRDEQ